jgi:signal transduction histidine kinase
VLTVTPYIVLVTIVVFTIGMEWGAWARLVPELILCGVAIVWILVFRDLTMPWRNRPAVVAVFLTGLIGLTLALVVRESWFGFVTIAPFMFSYSIVPWPWEMLPVAATATVAGLAQSSGMSRDTPVEVAGVIAVIVLNIVVMCGLSWGVTLAQRRVQNSATDVERARMAREIHDTLAQGFAGIVTQLQAAEQTSDEAARRRHTDAALALARDGLAEARRSVNALRPAALAAVRLPDALRNVARAWSVRTGIPVHVQISGDQAGLTTDTEVALLRTAQEGLTNVERHADARRVVLTLRSDRAGTHLELRDDGRGFDPDAPPASAADPRPGGFAQSGGFTQPDGIGQSGGFGLVAMRQRLESVAGALLVESRPGQGTVIRAEVPA